MLELPLMHNTGSDTTVAVCSKMAPIDMARARRIVKRRISADAPAYGPYTLGLMAQALASSDKPTARRLIDDAYSALERSPQADNRLLTLVSLRSEQVYYRSSSKLSQID